VLKIVLPILREPHPETGSRSGPHTN
jgi:hypothetical protein